jgi:hypothetical protein
MKLETERIVDQQTHPALALIARRAELFARQGSIVAAWRRRGSHTYGPYYRLCYREGGRQRSVYLGREGALVAQLRQTLADLQRPLRQHRAVVRLERQVKTALRADKRRLNRHLRLLGLRMQGFEVRGWRTSPTRRWLRSLRFPRIQIPRIPGLRTPLIACRK